jgi:diaminobutyrate-2-oxoglutarate transaminase
VRIATGRQTLLSFDGAYHGMTQGALQLMGNLGPKAVLGGNLGGTQFLPFPYAFRSPFGLDAEGTVRASLSYIEHVLGDPESGVPHPAAMIVEIVQGEGGVIPADDAWVRGIRQATQHARVPLIIDEVQSGIARTGKMFAFEHAGIEPDVLVLSKAIGGSLPLSVVIYRSELDVWPPGSHAGTFRGNQLAMAAGTATLRFIRDEALHERAASAGERLRNRLQELQLEHPVIGEVRGRGLMLGIELIDPRATDRLGHPAAAPEIASRLQRACLERGLIAELGGRHGCVVRLLPPLIISDREIDQVVQILRDALCIVARPPASNH